MEIRKLHDEFLFWWLQWIEKSVEWTSSVSVQLKNFLVSFFFYNSAVQTVMYMASIFGAQVVF